MRVINEGICIFMFCEEKCKGYYFLGILMNVFFIIWCLLKRRIREFIGFSNLGKTF